jgi:hypothetical protein
MKPFTVLLLYPLDLQEDPQVPADTYLAWVHAENVTAAVHVAQKEAAFAQSPRRKMAAFVPLVAMEGHHDDVNPAMPRLYRPAKVRHECPCGHVWHAPAWPDKNCPRCLPVDA